MSSNFMKNAKSTTKFSRSRRTFDKLSSIKPPPPKKHLLINQPKSVLVVPIEKKTRNEKEELRGMFLETSWGKSPNVNKNYLSNDGQCIDHFETIDSNEINHILAFDKYQPSLRVFWKVPRAIARCHLVSTSI